MLKVAKFGGSSMADAGQYQKIRDIIRSDPSRRVVVVSAAGKRSAGDNKITDLLYLCYAHLQYGVSCDGIYQMIRERYGNIHRELGLRVDLEGVLDRLRSQMEQGISRDELVSARRVPFRPAYGRLPRLYVRGRRAVAVLPL